MRIRGRRVGGEPGPGPRDPKSLKVEATMLGEGGVHENAGRGLGLDHAGQGSLRRRVAFGIDVGPEGMTLRRELSAAVR